MTSLLGISAFYHDSAACLIINGKIIAAAQEERFTRIKHDSNYPKNAVNFVLNKCNLRLSDIDHIIFYEKPFLKFERLLETYVALAPKGFIQFIKAMPSWLKYKLFQKKELINYFKEQDKNFNDDNKIFFSEHHLSHAASAFYPSPFDEAIVLTADGVGEWATTTVAIGKGKNLEIKKEIYFPHSLGLLYSAFTYYAGFKVNGGEYKLMGLAPYGEPKYVNLIKDNLIDIKEDGSFRLNLDYFDYATGLKMTNSKFNSLFGREERIKNDKNIDKFYMDIASSIQNVTEEIIIKITKSLREEYSINNLCLAGGVALNCVANGKILKQNFFENIWVQPAAGDAGGSLGAALAFWHLEKGNERFLSKDDNMMGAFLGPEYSNINIEQTLKEIGANFKSLNQEELLNYTAEKIDEGKAIGWFQGKMEFGPRALGNRSIIADARSPDMQKKLNLKVKFRESFRPFAPAVLLENVNDWFDLDCESPYMLLVSDVKKKIIPAVTHVDNSARVQTVSKKNGIFYELIKKFKEKTDCPIIVNTSFNVRGEPPVNTPVDAFKCFMSTDLDVLVIGNCILEKEKQINFGLEDG